MDFGSLLDYAKQNDKPNKDVKCYRTTFGPPKKAPKAKCLSENIQKFLARKEEEEQQKLSEANKKREDLLALRAQDSKANKRVRAMLKSTKAANKAAIDDARDDVNTAVTMAGPSQPDEDDYGYVSQEASAFYLKLMDKYSSTPSNESNFSKQTSRSAKDLSSTKDRVRMALLKEEEEESMGHKRKRRRAKEEEVKGKRDDDDANIQFGMPDRKVLEKEPSSSYIAREKPEPEVKKRKPPPPPPMDFAQLLKVAAQKQFEPIKIEKKESKNDDEDRPMTKKQREEYLREKEYRLRKEERAAAAAKSKEKPKPNGSEMSPVVQVDNSDSRTSSKAPSIPRIPKLNGAKAISESQTRVSGNDNETQGKRSAPPQQMSSKEGNFGKQRVTEIARQNSVRPSSSAREQEMRAAEVKKNTMQPSSRLKDANPERKPLPVQSSVPSSKDRRPAIEGKKQLMTQSSKPVIKEERRQSNPKPVIKEEKRLATNQPLKPVIKEEKKQLNQTPRITIKEESKLLQPEYLKVPTKAGRPSSGGPVSKQSQPPPQSSSSMKPLPNVVKRTDDKLSRNSQVGCVPPTGSSMLKERLTSASSQSLPQKNQQSSNQTMKKEIKAEPLAKSKSSSSAPPARPTLPKEMPNKPSASRPQIAGSQVMSREGSKGCPPERRRELPPKGEMRRPPSMYDRGPPRGRGFPPNRQRPMHPQDARRRPTAKRRIESDDEYDSELDDFIDDGPEEGEDYSKYIKEIFGYDKSRYSVVEVDDEEECMESSFAQQMKEEFVSTKLGILEDLEDIKKEQMEKMKKKTTSKKRKV